MMIITNDTRIHPSETPNNIIILLEALLLHFTNSPMTHNKNNDLPYSTTTIIIILLLFTTHTSSCRSAPGTVVPCHPCVAATPAPAARSPASRAHQAPPACGGTAPSSSLHSSRLHVSESARASEHTLRLPSTSTLCKIARNILNSEKFYVGRHQF